MACMSNAADRDVVERHLMTPGWASDPRINFVRLQYPFDACFDCLWAMEGVCLIPSQSSGVPQRAHCTLRRTPGRLGPTRFLTASCFHWFALLLCEKRRASPAWWHVLQPSSGPHAKRLIGSAAASIDRLLSKPCAWDLILLLSSRWEAVLKANELFLAQAVLCKAGNLYFNTQILGNRSVQLKKSYPCSSQCPAESSSVEGENYSFPFQFSNSFVVRFT